MLASEIESFKVRKQIKHLSKLLSISIDLQLPIKKYHITLSSSIIT